MAHTVGYDPPPNWTVGWKTHFFLILQLQICNTLPISKKCRKKVFTKHLTVLKNNLFLIWNFKTWPKTVKNVPVPASQQCLQYRGSGYDECVTSNIGGLNFFFLGGGEGSERPPRSRSRSQIRCLLPPPPPAPRPGGKEIGEGTNKIKPWKIYI